MLRDLENRGGIGFPYRIVVEPSIPTSSFMPNESQVSVPRGGTAAVGVTVVRKGYSGPITVTVADPPAGLTVRPARSRPVRRGRPLAVRGRRRQVSAAPIKLVGSGAGSRTVRSSGWRSSRWSTPSRPLCQPARSPSMAWSPPLHWRRLSHSTRPPPRSKSAHGLSATIPINVTRTKGQTQRWRFHPPVAAGLTIPALTIADKAAEGKVTVKTAVAAPLGTMTVGLQAKGKFAGAETDPCTPRRDAVDRPPRHRRVERPDSRYQARRDRSRSKARSCAKGLRRSRDRQDQRPARGPEGRPGHRGRQRIDLLVKVVADAKAAPASAGTQVAIAYQIEKKDYSVPPPPLAVKVLPIK